MSKFGDFFGSAHMYPEHNVLFSIGDLTMAPGVQTMENGDLGGCIGTPFSTTGAGVNYLFLPLDFSTDSSTEGRMLGDNSMFLTSSQSTSEDPEIVLALAALSGAVTTYGGGGAVIYIIIFKNDQPNSRVEKNAAAVYHSLHGGKAQAYGFPAVITESPSGYSSASKVFGGRSLDRTMETLDVWETILQEYVND